MACTSSTPMRCAAAATSGFTAPTTVGGLEIAIDSTPASCAGMTLMSTVLGYAARPPGT